MMLAFWIMPSGTGSYLGGTHSHGWVDESETWQPFRFDSEDYEGRYMGPCSGGFGC